TRGLLRRAMQAPLQLRLPSPISSPHHARADPPPRGRPAHDAAHCGSIESDRGLTLVPCSFLHYVDLPRSACLRPRHYYSASSEYSASRTSMAGASRWAIRSLRLSISARMLPRRTSSCAIRRSMASIYLNHLMKASAKCWSFLRPALDLIEAVGFSGPMSP